MTDCPKRDEERDDDETRHGHDENGKRDDRHGRDACYGIDGNDATDNERRQGEKRSAGYCSHSLSGSEQVSAHRCYPGK